MSGLRSLALALLLPGGLLAAGLGERLLDGRAGLLMAMETGSGRLLLRTDRRTYRGALPIGSLVKPFTLLAWGRTRGPGETPEVYCPPGGPPVCWYPPGHGRVGVLRALERSCNLWFSRLAAGVEEDRVREVLRDFGLDPDLESLAPEDRRRARVGLGSGARYEPQAVLEAYAALLGDGRRVRTAPRRPVYLGRRAPLGALGPTLLTGMARAARDGTGQAARDHFAVTDMRCKTGTAAHLDRHGRPTEKGTSAWFVGGAPAERPRLVVLVHLEEGTGSRDAAPLGGKLLAALWSRVRTSPWPRD